MKLHLRADRPLLYLSGNGSSNVREKDLFKVGCRYRCYSYAYTCPGAFYYNKRMKEALDTSVSQGVGIMMDSAAHSIHVLIKKGFKYKGKYNVTDIEKIKEIVMDSYTKYVKEEKKNWDFYVNFDYVKHCPTVYAVQKELEKRGIRPIPVYHGDMELEWLERYCKEGYKLIGIGTIKTNSKYRERRGYYDKVFNVLEKHGVLAHGLAMTGLSLMYLYPWYSVDSATWAKTAAYGSMLHIDTNRQIIGEIHITDKNVGGKTCYNRLPKDLQRDLRHTVEDRGFDFKKMQTDGAVRSLYNVWMYCNEVNKHKDLVKGNLSRWRSLL